ncbi:T9SS type A sorting domain-containing protein [bacterium]|nr:T9SS type A sorting domain-containing protein [bacterium]
MDKNDTAWIKTLQRGMVRFDGSGFTFLSGDENFPENSTTNIEIGPDGNAWVGTLNGLYKYSGESWEAVIPAEIETSADTFKKLAFDINGDIYIGLGFGLAVYNDEGFTQINLETAPPTNTIMSMASGNSTVWIGYNMGDGVGCYDGSSWRRFTMDHGLPGDYARDIAVTDDGVPWFAIHDAIAYYQNGSFFSKKVFHDLSGDEQYVEEIAIAPDGKVWFRNGYNHIGFYDGETWNYENLNGLIPYSYGLSAVYIDSNNDVWVGTDNGVSKYDGNSWHTFSVAEGFLPGGVNRIAEDHAGVMWFTSPRGIARFDGRSWTTFDTILGERLEYVLSIAIDNDNVKWFGTQYRGIFWFDDKVWYNKEMKNGSKYINTSDITVTEDNTIWFATAEGLLSSKDKDESSVSEQTAFPRVQLSFPSPNPFNPSTTIGFTLPERMNATVAVYNVAGQRVTVLHDGFLDAGSHSLVWNATGQAAGVYFCRLTAGEYTATQKMLFVK